MSLWPGEKLRYAETHFKFRLPWSLLYKPWPEIIVDSPFQFVPGVEPTLWIVIRDADRFPTKIKTVEIHLKHSVDGFSKPDIEIQKDLDFDAHEQMQFIPFPLGEIPTGTYEAYCKLTVQREGKTQTFERWNLPRLPQKPLRFKVLNEAPPIAPGYAAGEMHCHTHYSADHVEYGATPAVLQQAAKAVGLDFVSCTDHAYDFAFTLEDYTKEAESPVPRFQKLREEIAALPSKDENGNDMPLMLAGEEVSAGNSKGENVHMTVLAPEGYLPGLGDCGRYWLDNKPTRSIKQILNMTGAHCFAAHPFQQMGLLEKFIFRRGYWKPEDLQLNNKHTIRGLQFWNGVRDEGFKLGREFWINELGKGNYLLPIGGNDAHGDLIRRQVVRMVLTEGLNRQIRRMWKQEGIEVKALKRTRVVNITLGDLEPGEYSILSDKQVADLRKALEKDSLAPRPKKTPRKFAHNVMKTGEGRLKTVPAGPRKTSLRGANPRLKELAEKSGKVKQGPGKKR